MHLYPDQHQQSQDQEQEQQEPNEGPSIMTGVYVVVWTKGQWEQAVVEQVDGEKETVVVSSHNGQKRDVLHASHFGVSPLHAAAGVRPWYIATPTVTHQS
jgi:hypothetical protein